MAEEGLGGAPEDGLVVTVYARVTGGGFRGAVSIRRAGDEKPLELACELPEIFACAHLAQLAAGEFAIRARTTGTLLHVLEGWEKTRSDIRDADMKKAAIFNK